MKDLLIIATLVQFAVLAVFALGTQSTGLGKLTPEEYCERQTHVSFEECFVELTK